jgi:response regulator of citrate/malate metabolism
MSRLNGAEPDRLTQIVDALHTELAAEDAAVGQAEAALAEARGRRARIQRAIDTLQGTPKAARAKKVTKGWIIGEPKVEQVRALMVTRDEPVTVGEMAKETGMTRESARRALKVLRDRDLVRMTGKRPGRGGGQELFMPMPELTNAG